MIFRRPKVLGAGLVALDLVVSSDPAAPIQGWAGGTCGNVMAILGWHGWDAYPIARMNGDTASARVQADLSKWGVRLDLANCTPATNTPIVVQEIRRSAKGEATHKFSWSCLRCGGWLPSFKPITQHVVDPAQEVLPGTSVFFFDRLSRGTLQLAWLAAEEGALVFFEPSGRGDERLFTEALEVAHVVKYADQRIGALADASPGSNRMLEIQTHGAHGLRYRTLRRRSHERWRELKAVDIRELVDSCGAGDWCTAGLIAQLGDGGSAALADATLAEIRDGLMYGQQLAAWNCGFEGARGGMYASAVADAPIKTAVRRTIPTKQPENQDGSGGVIHCPRCDVA